MGVQSSSAYTIWPTDSKAKVRKCFHYIWLCWKFKISLKFTVVIIIINKLRALICLVCILFFNFMIAGFVTETEPIITEPAFFKPKPNPNPNRRLRFSISGTEDIWLRFRFYHETEPNRPMLSPSTTYDPFCTFQK